jgi:hypothetical protein
MRDATRQRALLLQKFRPFKVVASFAAALSSFLGIAANCGSKSQNAANRTH